MVTRYMTRAEYTGYKSRLTRVINRYMAADPLEVVRYVDSVFAKWNALGMAYPDDWSRWQRARDDALAALRFGKVGL